MKDEKEDKNFEQYLRKRFEDFESEPPPMAWQKISGEIKKPLAPNQWKWLYPFALSALILISLPSDIFEINAGEQKSAQNKNESPNRDKSAFLAMNKELSISNEKNKTINERNFANKKLENLTDNDLTKQSKKSTEKDKTKTNGYFKKGRSKGDRENDKVQAKTNNSLVKTDEKNKEIQPEKIITTHDRTKKITAENTESPLNTKVEIAPISREKNTRKNYSFDLISSQKINIQSQRSFYSKAVIDSVNAPPFKLRKAKPLYLKFYLAPLFTFKRIQPNQYDATYITSFDSQSGFSSQNAGFAWGINLEQHIWKGLSLYGGLGFSQLKVKLDYDYRNTKAEEYEYNFSPTKVEVTPLFVQKSEQISNTFLNLNWQIGMKYLLSDKKYAQSLTLGLGNNHLLKTNQNSLSGEVGESSTEQNSKLLTLGYEVSYKINERFRLSLEPNFAYYLDSFYNQKAAFELKPYTLGLQFGLSWQLK